MRSSISHSTIRTLRVQVPALFFRDCLHRITSYYRLLANYSRRIGHNSELADHNIAVENRHLPDTAASGRHEI